MAATTTDAAPALAVRPLRRVAGRLLRPARLPGGAGAGGRRSGARARRSAAARDRRAAPGDRAPRDRPTGDRHRPTPTAAPAPTAPRPAPASGPRPRRAGTRSAPAPAPPRSPRARHERARLPLHGHDGAAARGRAARAVRAGIEAIAARLTRFDPASELCALNADPRADVPASPLLRRAVQAALLGARRTGGLADPTLLRCRRGRRLRPDPWSASSPPRCEAALRAAPRSPRGHAGAALARGRGARGDDPAGRAGLRIDLGGSAKGLAADWAASQLARALRRRLRRRRARRRHPRRRPARHRPHAAGHRRRRRHLRHRPARLAAARRLVRAPPARPRHRRAGLDRRDLAPPRSPRRRSRPRRSRRPRARCRGPRRGAAAIHRHGERSLVGGA